MALLGLTGPYKALLGRTGPYFAFEDWLTNIVHYDFHSQKVKDKKSYIDKRWLKHIFKNSSKSKTKVIKYQRYYYTTCLWCNVLMDNDTFLWLTTTIENINATLNVIYFQDCIQLKMTMENIILIIIRNMTGHHLTWCHNGCCWSLLL